MIPNLLSPVRARIQELWSWLCAQLSQSNVHISQMYDFNAILCYAMLCHTILWYTILCYDILYYDIQYYAMPCHAMPCHAMVWYDIFALLSCTLLTTRIRFHLVYAARESSRSLLNNRTCYIWASTRTSIHFIPLIQYLLRVLLCILSDTITVLLSIYFWFISLI